MPPTCSVSSPSECRFSRVEALPSARASSMCTSCSFALFLLCACGPQEGIVGRQHAADAADSAASFTDDFVTNDGTWNPEMSLAGAGVDFGITNGSARDGNVARLVFPGDASLTSTDALGPGYVTQLSTRDRFGFGTLRTRLSFGGCSGTEEVVQAVLGYFSDGVDRDGNGITDDIEIDLQVTCSAPRFVYLSVYTDYEATPSGEQFRKLSHIVDLSTGTEYDTPSDDSDAFVQSGKNAKLARPNLATTNGFYEIGYEWHPDRIRFFLDAGNEELTLWTLSDAAHVPQVPVHIMYNLWHPDSHWFPDSASADYPASDVVMTLDWVRFEPSDN